ncbi:MAG: radical SAM protein [Planctomycetes bacterium]|nr:radical SAM protein [Planctomycetota bacterium]
MGILHRLFNRRAQEVWRAQTRLLHRLGYVFPPQAVQWISTSACDLRCPHCYSCAGPKSDRELTTDEAKRLIVDELVELDRPTLVIAGGEPLLRADFAEIVQHAHGRDVPWALHTHGGHVERLLDVFRNFPPVMVAVSLDGPREYHDTFRGRRGCFDQALTAIRALKGIGCKEVVAGTTVTRQNADLLADMVPTVLSCGADSWGLHLMTAEGRAAENTAMLATSSQLRRAAAFARRMRSVMHVELDDEWGSAGADDCYYRDEPFLCGAGRSTCVVSADGHLMPCTTTDPSQSQGSIRDCRLGELWADGFAAFRGGGKQPQADALDCWLQTRHGRSCRRCAFDEPDSAGEPALVRVSEGGAR